MDFQRMPRRQHMARCKRGCHEECSTYCLKNCAGDASDATLLPALDPERLILQDLFQELVSPTNVSHSGPGDESDWLITTWIEMRVNNDYLIAS